MRYAIKIAYDGSHFNGFAMQPNKKTIEGEILKRLIKTKLIESRRKNKFQYAARTDKGVSSFGNVIAFNTNANPINALKNMENIWIVGFATVESNFNPRHAKYKIYRYYILNKNFNIEKMKKAAKLFVGKHDFSSFARLDKRNPIRKIDKIEFFVGNVIKIDFYASSFLWNQLRRIMAAIIKVGEGKAKIDEIKEALNGKRKNFGIASPSNLILLDVIYDDIEFKRIIPDEIVIKKEIYKDAFDYLKHAINPRNVGFSYPVE